MKTKITLFTVLILNLWTHSVSATGIPVFDFAAFLGALESYISSIEQISNQVNQIRRLDKQIKTMDSQVDALTGSRNMGMLLNTPDFQAIRRWLPEDMQQTVSIMAAGGGAVSLDGKLAELDALLAIYDLVQHPGRVPIGDIPAKRVAINQHSAGTALVTAGISQAAMNQANDNHLVTIESLIGEINNTTDLKASVDLNSRIVAQNALLINDLLRVNAASSNFQAESLLAERQAQSLSAGYNNMSVTSIDGESL